MNKILEAIKKINPSAQVSITDEDINTIVWENGTTPISVADIQAQIPAVEAAITKKIADKASANAKLKALGLTDDEIEAIK